MTTVTVCDHGTPTHIECPPCDRAAGVGRPVGGGPRTVRTRPARHHGYCRCNRGIWPGDQIGLDPDADEWVCEPCAHDIVLEA